MTTSPGTEASPYLHGTNPDEQSRLSLLNDLMNARCLSAISPGKGERVLDVGSGLGQMSRAFARATGVRVVGVERSGEQIGEARRQAEAAGESSLVEFRQGDATALPLAAVEVGAFDLVHTRFVLEHVPDPLSVVRQMVNAAKPGGRIVLLDDDHDILRVWPEIPGLGPVWAAYMRTYDRLGCDPYIGRRLVQLLHQAGATPTRNHWVWFGACGGDSQLPHFVENLLGVLRTAEARMVEGGLVEPGALAALEVAARAWGTRPDASLWFAVAMAEGVRGAE